MRVCSLNQQAESTLSQVNVSGTEKVGLATSALFFVSLVEQEPLVRESQTWRIEVASRSMSLMAPA